MKQHAITLVIVIVGVIAAHYIEEKVMKKKTA